MTRAKTGAILAIAVSTAILAIGHGTADAQEVRIIERFAGGSNGDGGPALGASLSPIATAVDNDGNVYLADTLSNSIRVIDAATGEINVVAGTGGFGATGDGGPATEATLRGPSDVDVDAAGNVYIADRGNQKIRKVDAQTGIITTIAGNGQSGFSGDGGPAINATFNNPTSVAVAPNGDVFVSDTTNERIRQIFAGGAIRTYAGNGATGTTGDGGPATNARLGRPWGIGLDDNGNLYFAELLNQRIRVVYANETIDTFAGTGQFAICDNVHRLEACFKNPTNVAYNSGDDSLYITDTGNHRIRKVSLATDIITTASGGSDGTSSPSGFSGDGGPANEAKYDGPLGVSAHKDFGIFIADEHNYRIRQIFLDDTVDTIAGNGNLPSGGDGGPALSSKLNAPGAMATNGLGNLYIPDTANHRIRVVDANGTIDTLAGTGLTGYNGDNIPGTQANLSSPAGVTADDNGNVYIADTSHNRIRHLQPNGIIRTLLGDGTSASTGDGGQASNAQTLRPQGVAYWQNAGGTVRYLYFTEPLTQLVRRVNLNTNVVTRFAGDGTRGYGGDGGPAASAHLALPLDLSIDDAGSLYIADAGNHRIRKVTNGIISTVAGNGTFDYAGDGGLAISASLGIPDGVAISKLGNLYINDSANLRIRVVSTDGIIQTAAGTGVQTGSIDGEGGNILDDLNNGLPSVVASFTQPRGVAIDDSGNLYISDAQADTVRWVEDMDSVFQADPMNAVFGTVRHATTFQALAGVDVDLLGPTSQPTISTGSNGAYSAEELTGSTWLVEPSKQGGFGRTAVSALDASYVLQYLVNSRNLSEAQMLACDVTGDGSLSPLDATHILQRSLETPPFSNPFGAAEACQSDWLFLPNPDPALNQSEIEPLLQGGNTCRMGAIQYNPLAGQPDGQDFLGVVIGDCTGNWNGGGVTGGLTSDLARAAERKVVVLGPQRQSRRRLRLPVSVRGSGEFSAIELHLDYNPAKLRPIKPRTRGEANGALVSWRETGAGKLALVIASGQRMTAPARALVVVDFEILGRDRRPGLTGASAAIDENDVGVRFKRRRRR